MVVPIWSLWSQVMKQKLTKTAVEKIQPGNQDKIVWDTDLKGFGVKVTPRGRRSYFVRYRVGGGRNGRQRKPTIGTHGVVTCDQARDVARRTLAAARDGKDPFQEKKAQINAETVSDFWQIYRQRHLKVRTKPKTQADVVAMFDRHILPALGKQNLRAITKADISRLHSKLHAKPFQANRVLSTLSGLFGRAEEWGHRDEGSNPCRNIKRYPEPSRESFLTRVDRDRLTKVLDQREEESPFAVAFFRLALLTGCRKNELLRLLWSEVDLVGKSLHLPDSKTGKRTIFLSTEAVKVLDDVPRVSSNPHVFPGAKEGAHLVNVNKIWLKIREEAGLPNVRIHDLRHTFASIAVESGLGLPVIGELLGHSNAATTQRYAHLAEEHAREAVEAVGMDAFADQLGLYLRHAGNTSSALPLCCGDLMVIDVDSGCLMLAVQFIWAHTERALNSLGYGGTTEDFIPYLRDDESDPILRITGLHVDEDQFSEWAFGSDRSPEMFEFVLHFEPSAIDSAWLARYPDSACDDDGVVSTV
eukprot:s1_g1428.t1